jgi:hypothetical protein
MVCELLFVKNESHEQLDKVEVFETYTCCMFGSDDDIAKILI